MGSPEDTPFTDPVRHRVMRAPAGFKSFVVNLSLEPELRAADAAAQCSSAGRIKDNGVHWIPI